MSKNLYVICLIFAILVFQSCSSVISQNSNSEVKSETSQPRIDEVPKQQNVDFKGVSFNYNPQIFGKVKSEEVPEFSLENETDKPDFVAPQHIRFTFGLAKPFTETNIRVFPVNDFPRMYAVNQLSVKAVEEEFNNLRKVLKDKDFRVENDIPYVPFIDAGQDFQTKVKHFNFQSGRGILFITYLRTEISLIGNDHLIYIFEGLTDGGKHYILAEMPVSVKFLPEDSPEEYEGYKRSYLFKDNPHPNVIEKRYKDYVSKIAKRLDNLSPNEFEPNLKHFEEMVSSIRVEK